MCVHDKECMLDCVLELLTCSGLVCNVANLGQKFYICTTNESLYVHVRVCLLEIIHGVTNILLP